MKGNGIIRAEEPKKALSDRESGGVGTSTHAAKRVGCNPESAKKVRRGAEMRCAASRDGSPTAHDPAEAEGRESQLLQRWEYVNVDPRRAEQVKARFKAHWRDYSRKRSKAAHAAAIRKTRNYKYKLYLDKAQNTPLDTTTKDMV